MQRNEEKLHRAAVEYLRATLRERLAYDPETGAFTWLKDVRLKNGGLRVAAGTRAGTLLRSGYRSIQVWLDGKPKGLREHRLAWLFVHGEWPADQLDHINGDRADNRIVNLRPATNSLNMANRKLNANSKSGVKGVCFHRGSQRWRARLQFDGKRIHLGDYLNKEAAEIAYAAAAQRHFGAYARLK